MNLRKDHYWFRKQTMFPSKSKSTAAGGKGVEFCPPVAGLSSADPPPPLFLHQTVNGGVPSLSGCRAHSPPKTSRRQIRQGKSGKIRTLASSRALVSLGQVSLAKVQRVPPLLAKKGGEPPPGIFFFFPFPFENFFCKKNTFEKASRIASCGSSLSRKKKAKPKKQL